MKVDEETRATLYEENVGRPPRNVYADDPDWNYGGTKEEQDELRERVEGDPMENQEKLFDG